MDQVGSIQGNVLARDTLKELITKLSSDKDEFKKFLLLTADSESALLAADLPTEREVNHLLFRNDKEYWTEVVFVLQRYDLLKLIESSEKDALEQVQNRTYFPIFRRLLVKLYDEIPLSKEEQFCSRFGKMISDQSGENLPLTQILLKFEKLMRVENLTNMRSILEELDLKKALCELNRYLESIEIKAKKTYYPMEKSPCGKCIIINNKYVSGEDERLGSDIDKNALYETFTNFDFKVECFENLSKQNMLNVLKKTAGEDHTNYSAFVCCIMSHGENGIVYSADGEKVKIQEIRMLFCGCKSLLGKPKLFFYQACRGRNVQRGDGVRLQMDGPASVRIEDSQKDCLIGMSTVEGNASFRDPYRGSLFIQSLVNVFKNVVEMSDARCLVNKEVTEQQLPCGSNTVSQTPEWWDTLTADVKFRKLNA